MSLKGYQWLDDDGHVIMAFYFKDCRLYLFDDVTQSQLDDFTQYLKDNHNDVIKIDCNGHTIKEQ